MQIIYPKSINPMSTPLLNFSQIDIERGRIAIEVDKYKIINGDSKEVLKEFDDNSFDAIITDPPYNISIEDCSVKLEGRADIDLDFGNWDYEHNLSEYIEELCRVLKPGGSILVFSSDVIFGDNMRALKSKFNYKSTICWHKTNPVPSFTKKNYLSACEYVLWAVKDGDKYTFNFTQQQDMHNYTESSLCMGKERIYYHIVSGDLYRCTGSKCELCKQGHKRLKHPTQKPERVVRRLVEVHTNPGDIILDPFCGVGTTIKCACDSDRAGVGVELDPIYAELSLKRLEGIK